MNVTVCKEVRKESVFMRLDTKRKIGKKILLNIMVLCSAGIFENQIVNAQENANYININIFEKNYSGIYSGNEEKGIPEGAGSVEVEIVL